MLRRCAVEFASESGMSARGLADVDLGVAEAVSNAVVHGRSDRAPRNHVRLEARCSKRGLLVRVRDYGAGVPHARARCTQTRPGYGLQLIAAVTRSFELCTPEGGGTEVAMWFPLCAHAPSGDLRAPPAKPRSRIGEAHARP